MNKFTQTYKPINLEQRLLHSVEKNRNLLSLQKFRETNLRYDLSVKKLISHNYCLRFIRMKFCNFHTVFLRMVKY